MLAPMCRVTMEMVVCSHSDETVWNGRGSHGCYGDGWRDVLFFTDEDGVVADIIPCYHTDQLGWAVILCYDSNMQKFVFCGDLTAHSQVRTVSVIGNLGRMVRAARYWTLQV